MKIANSLDSVEFENNLIRNSCFQEFYMLLFGISKY